MAGGSLRVAYVTLLVGNGDEIMGVVCLAKGLRKVKSAHPLLVAVSPIVPEEHLQLLESQGCIVRKIESLYMTQSANVINYSKLRLWEFDDFDQLIYLDAKVQVYGNIDELFHYLHGDQVDGHDVLYGVLDCFCETTTSADNPQYNINSCQEELYFNDGVIVFQPSKKTYQYLLNTLDNTQPTPTPVALKDHFNKVFKGVCKPISLIYNLNLALLWRHPEHVVDVNRLKVVHYCAVGSQPWSYTGKEENMEREDVKMLVKKWWEVYNDESLDYKPPTQEDR